MNYDTPKALRIALERRLQNEAQESGLALDRLRRRVVFQRIVTRLQRSEPGRWVLKGGMALEVRLGDDARLTKDIDLGLRDDVPDADDLRDRLIESLAEDADRDGFAFAVAPAQRMAPDGGGHLTWRVAVTAELAGRQFGAVKLDVSPRAHELEATEIVTLPNSLAFAGLDAVEIEIVDVHRHAAEKLHAMSREYGDRENSRVRDLVDLMLLCDHELLRMAALADAVKAVWTERENTPPPPRLTELPSGWPVAYERLAAEHDVDPPTFTEAAALAAALWAQMFTPEES
jgi:predicted nucleotidyltransferase component of viral defense system